MHESDDYEKNVFINCPFCDEYKDIRYSIIFAIFDCGFIPRCALEEDNSSELRFKKIKRLIDNSKYGIHDISKVELNENELPRFNMPLELGMFIGAKTYGDKRNIDKSMLIFEREKYRYQEFISDISGKDVKPHENKEENVIICIRNWLSESISDVIPGGKRIYNKYLMFRLFLPSMCKEVKVELSEITYGDYCKFVSKFLKEFKG